MQGDFPRSPPMHWEKILACLAQTWLQIRKMNKSRFFKVMCLSTLLRQNLLTKFYIILFLNFWILASASLSLAQCCRIYRVTYERYDGSQSRGRAQFGLDLELTDLSSRFAGLFVFVSPFSCDFYRFDLRLIKMLECGADFYLSGWVCAGSSKPFSLPTSRDSQPRPALRSFGHLMLDCSCDRACSLAVRCSYGPPLEVVDFYGILAMQKLFLDCQKRS